MGDLMRFGLIPAEPGWSIVKPVTEGDRVVDLWSDPIVAWVISYEQREGEEDVWWSIARPVTPSQGMFYEDDYALLSPKGFYIFPENCDRESRDEAIAVFQEAADQERKRREENASIQKKILRYFAEHGPTTEEELYAQMGKHVTAFKKLRQSGSIVIANYNPYRWKLKEEKPQ